MLRRKQQQQQQQHNARTVSILDPRHRYHRGI